MILERWDTTPPPNWYGEEDEEIENRFWEKFDEGLHERERETK